MTGSLGFMTPFTVSSFKKHLSNVVDEKGNLYVSLRDRLQCLIYRNRKLTSEANTVKTGQVPCADVCTALNEICLDRGGSPFLTNLSVYVDGHYVTDVRADGMNMLNPCAYGTSCILC